MHLDSQIANRNNKSKAWLKLKSTCSRYTKVAQYKNGLLYASLFFGQIDLQAHNVAYTGLSRQPYYTTPTWHHTEWGMWKKVCVIYLEKKLQEIHKYKNIFP
jgi:hypothetical protein